MLYGFVTRGIPFFRTPKMRSSHGLLVALAEAREEVFVMLLLWGAAAGIVAVQGVPSRDLLIWVAMLLVQSLPYLAALVMALLCRCRNRARTGRRRRADRRLRSSEASGQPAPLRLNGVPSPTFML